MKSLGPLGGSKRNYAVLLNISHRFGSWRPLAYASVGARGRELLESSCTNVSTSDKDIRNEHTMICQSANI
jgi:hypothetical protein